MFRLSRLLKYAMEGSPAQLAQIGNMGAASSPMVIWNITQSCNFSCAHCYLSSVTAKSCDELSEDQALETVRNLHKSGVKYLVLAGGEPLLREDLLPIIYLAKQLDMHVSISTNGTLIENSNVKMLLNAGIDYVGVKMDGSCETHDRLYGAPGTYDKVVRGISLLKSKGIRTGIRFTMSSANISDLNHIFQFAEKYDVERIYLSHLAYRVKGEENKNSNIPNYRVHKIVECIIAKAVSYIENGSRTEIITGNNEADKVLLTLWMMKKDPATANKLLEMLEGLGGDGAGAHVASIDPWGDVHPDPFMQYINLGNITEKPFSEIWNSDDNTVLNVLRQSPRKIKGRCANCRWIKVCGGNNRDRAWRMTGDFMTCDPACYITDEETRSVTAYAV